MLRHHRGTDDQLPSGRSTTVTCSAYFTLLSVCPGKTDRQESVTGHILAVGATSQSVAPYEFVIAFARECPAWNNNERRQCLSTIHLPFGEAVSVKGRCWQRLVHNEWPSITTALNIWFINSHWPPPFYLVSDDTGETITVRGCALDSGTLTTDTEIIRMSHCGRFFYDDRWETTFFDI